MVPGPLDDIPRPRNDRPLHSLHPYLCDPYSSAQADWAGTSSSSRLVDNNLDTCKQNKGKSLFWGVNYTSNGQTTQALIQHLLNFGY